MFAVYAVITRNAFSLTHKAPDQSKKIQIPEAGSRCPEKWPDFPAIL